MPTEQDLYAQAGVDVNKADRLVDWLKNQRHGNLIGGFSAAVGIPGSDLEMVCSTDGVGTKTLLAQQENKLEGLGQDLVGMCVNDLYTIGARPIGFLDYFASNQVDEAQFQVILRSLMGALMQCDCPLLGGETAETPGVYADNHFDLAGFVVGVVGKRDKITGAEITPGDRIFALPSNGFHSNGFTLLRKWISEFDALKPSIEYCLRPTTIYGNLPRIWEKVSIKGLAHITGGGLSGNICRILPENTSACLDWKSLPIPLEMREIFQIAEVDAFEVESTFNLGVGMIAVVAASEVDSFLEESRGYYPGACEVGEITPRNPQGLVYYSR